MTTRKHYGIEDLERDFGPMTFGRAVRAHRRSEELTQVQQSKILGISKQSLNDIENGRSLPSFRRAMAIAKKVGFSEELAIFYVIRDQLRREKLNFDVTLTKAKPKKKKSA
jgi:DNA-binding XRE family transcriptional regulator